MIIITSICVLFILVLFLLLNRQYRENARITAQRNELRNVKHEVLSIIDHQLNTPVSVLRSAISLIEQGDITADEVHGFIKKLSPRLQEFYRTVENINIAAHAIGGCDLGKNEVTEVAALIESAIERVGSSKNIKVHIKGKQHSIIGDRYLLSVAIGNIIENAVLYSNSDLVNIDVRKKRGTIYSSISNECIDLTQQELQQIGSLFFRGKQAQELQRNGSGLGVYVAKTIIEESGGSVEFNRLSNKGLKVTISIPMQNI